MSEWKQLWLQYHPVADRGFAAYAERVVLEGFEESGGRADKGTFRHAGEGACFCKRGRRVLHPDY